MSTVRQNLTHLVIMYAYECNDNVNTCKQSACEWVINNLGHDR